MRANEPCVDVPPKRVGHPRTTSLIFRNQKSSTHYCRAYVKSKSHLQHVRHMKFCDNNTCSIKELIEDVRFLLWQILWKSLKTVWWCLIHRYCESKHILSVTDDGDCQLWHIRYDDGDEEDLNVREMQKCRDEYLDDDDGEYVDEEWRMMMIVIISFIVGTPTILYN